MTPGWYLTRLRSMGAREIAWRARNAALQRVWRRRAGAGWRVSAAHPRWAGGRVPLGVGSGGSDAGAVLTAARGLLDDGRWPVFAAEADLSGTDPDWFRDPATGIRAPAAEYWSAVPYRDQARAGNVKHVWELSRLQHVTVLAAAYHLSGEERFARRALDHLRSWWGANPPLRGVHWVSGIEIGLRLVAWTWARRLLAGYPAIGAAFEGDPLFRRQVHAHQAWIATFYSRGTSANNHLIAEMAGLLAASRAFPMFPQSARWARLAAAQLEREIGRQTFADGLNRELAGDYHTFAAELFLVAGIEADAAGPALSDGYWAGLGRMLDALAATVDVRGQPARQGDGDDGRALLLAAPGASAVQTLLETGARVLRRAEWWPLPRTSGVGAALLASIAGDHQRNAASRPAARPSLFPDAGISILRDLVPDGTEIWARFDHGPHGFLATAAHAHADALAFELRFGGQEVLVDPGTYCYHGERAWRDYFRSTIAHNALELEARDQAEHAGPFLWRTMPRAELLSASGLSEGPVASAEARHDGYRASRAAAMHRRRLVLDRVGRSLAVTDWIEGAATVNARLAFHFHPAVECRLEGSRASLSWEAVDGRRHATLTLAPELRWSAHRGETDPILGWYSPHFGRKQPSVALVGSGLVAPGRALRSEIAFLAARREAALPARQTQAA